MRIMWYTRTPTAVRPKASTQAGHMLPVPRVQASEESTNQWSNKIGSNGSHAMCLSRCL
jgi:hypothetical protein